MRVRGIEYYASESEGPGNSELEEGACLIAESDWEGGVIAENVGRRRGTGEGSGVRERLTGW